MAAPVITVISQDKTKISSISGKDQCITTFTSDTNLDAWQARATPSGTTPAMGVGILVESGETLAEGQTATVYVDDEELTSGDSEYTVTIYAHNVEGYYSDGSYESTVVASLSNFVDGWDYTNITNGVRLHCNPSNYNIANTKVGIAKFNGWSQVSVITETQQTGWKVVEFTKDSTFTWISLGVMGDVRDAGIMIDVSGLTNGVDYLATFNIDYITLNDTELTDIYILRKLGG